MGKFDYKGKLSFVERFCYLLVGITNIPIGFSLYYLFKDSKKEQANFLKLGAELGCGLILFIFIVYVVEMFLPM